MGVTYSGSIAGDTGVGRSVNVYPQSKIFTSETKLKE